MRYFRSVVTGLARVIAPGACAFGFMLSAALAQPARMQEICPTNLRAGGSFCVTDVPGSLRNTGTCPAGYVSTGDRAYCVLAPRNQWVLVKPGCPAGYQSSVGGEVCIGKETAP
jgi:hypothetical protein